MCPDVHAPFTPPNLKHILTIAAGDTSACPRGIVAQKPETEPNLVDKSVISAPKAILRWRSKAPEGTWV